MGHSETFWGISFSETTVVTSDSEFSVNTTLLIYDAENPRRIFQISRLLASLFSPSCTTSAAHFHAAVSGGGGGEPNGSQKSQLIFSLHWESWVLHSLLIRSSAFHWFAVCWCPTGTQTSCSERGVVKSKRERAGKQHT